MFDIISIAYIVIFLLFVLIGLKKGFFKALVSLIKSVLSFVLSILFCKPFANILVNCKFGLKLTDSLTEKFANKGGIFSSQYGASAFDSVFDSLSLPDFARELLESIIAKILPEIDGNPSVAEVIGKTLVYYGFLVLSFIIIFVIVSLVCLLLNKVFKLIEEIPVGKFINRALGMVLYAILGFAFICLISYGISYIVSLGGDLSEWFIMTMKLDEDSVNTISGYLYNQNILVKLIVFFQQLFVK